jgi:hypothetical protein
MKKVGFDPKRGRSRGTHGVSGRSVYEAVRDEQDIGDDAIVLAGDYDPEPHHTPSCCSIIDPPTLVPRLVRGLWSLRLLYLGPSPRQLGQHHSTRTFYKIIALLRLPFALVVSMWFGCCLRFCLKTTTNE